MKKYLKRLARKVRLLCECATDATNKIEAELRLHEAADIIASVGASVPNHHKQATNAAFKVLQKDSMAFREAFQASKRVHKTNRARNRIARLERKYLKSYGYIF